MAKEKVVLAYSGGLDTSIIIHWLIENYDYEVIAVCGDVGVAIVAILNAMRVNKGYKTLVKQK